MDARNLSEPELWASAVRMVKDRVNNRSLWETIEQAVGITIEDDIFIIGLNSRIFNQAGHLNLPEHRNAIESSLSQLAGRPLKVRIIEGDTLEDWVQTKKRDARIAAMREVTYDRRDHVQAESRSWDDLYEYVGRAYSGTSMRQLPQMKARFLADTLKYLCEAMEDLYPERPDDATERMLARVIDKIAQSAETPSTVVALELQRLRTRG